MTDEQLDFAKRIKTSKGDEYYTPKYAVDIILPHITKFKHIWCPFDTQDSQFVKVLQDNGYKVTYGHISTGQDFFEQEVPEGVDCIVSNPPFSQREKILLKLYELNIPFAVILNLNGLFDSFTRFELFKENKFELLIPKGRMQFYNEDMEIGHPTFQSCYVCRDVLENQIMFTDMVLMRRTRGQSKKKKK